MGVDDTPLLLEKKWSVVWYAEAVSSRSTRATKRTYQAKISGSLKIMETWSVSRLG